VVTFTDEIRGSISTDTTDLGDFVIARNINEPLYHLAVVVDDHDEGVTHVIRAEEHIANTPRQILLMEALGWDIPLYAHLPIVLGPDKQKLSKRKGALPMTAYAQEGYLKEAVFNCIAMIGWNPADPGSDQELFSVEELITRFDFNRVQKSAAVFNTDKLNWFNREYIKKLSSEDFLSRALPYIPKEIQKESEMLCNILGVIKDRVTTFRDVETLFAAGEFDYFFSEPSVDMNMIIWKGIKDEEQAIEKTKAYLREVHTRLSSVPMEMWNQENIKFAIWDYVETEGKGNVLWPLRVSLSGKEKSPDPFELASLLGKDTSLERIERIIKNS
jgi:nondiscriminating glutamyl-tRNA synthetase